MTDVPPILSEDNLLTAARRLVSRVRIDDAGGGMLSNDTVLAADWLWRHVEAETKRAWAAMKTRGEE